MLGKGGWSKIAPQCGSSCLGTGRMSRGFQVEYVGEHSQQKGMHEENLGFCWETTELRTRLGMVRAKV